MLPQYIQDAILVKLGIKNVSSRDCAFIGSRIDVSETTVKRFFGLIAETERKRAHFTSTLNRVAVFLGYPNYKELIKYAQADNAAHNETHPIHYLNIPSIKDGMEIHICHSGGEVIVMTYVGNGEFVVNHTKDCKLIQDTREKILAEEAS